MAGEEVTLQPEPARLGKMSWEDGGEERLRPLNSTHV